MMRLLVFLVFFVLSFVHGVPLEKFPAGRGVAKTISQRDARCVICQYVVQRIRTELTGYSFCPGEGITPDKIAAQKAQRRANMQLGKQLADAMTQPAPAPQVPAPPSPPAAAPAADPAAAAPAADPSAAPADASADPSGADATAAAAALFLEMGTDVDLDFMADASVSQLISTEAESLSGINAALQLWMAATDTAMEHSATEAVETYYPWDSPEWRNIAPNSYPPTLMTHGQDIPKRYRANGLLGYRPVMTRYGSADLDKVKLQQRTDRRNQYKKLYSSVWLTFEHICAKRMPMAYVGYCKELMENYRYIAQGLNYGDRPDTICMNGDWCPRSSYLYESPHTFYQKKAGDSEQY